MKNLKMYVLMTGVSLITIISIILSLILDCKIYGVYIAIFDVLSIFIYILIGNFIVEKNYKK